MSTLAIIAIVLGVLFVAAIVTANVYEYRVEKFIQNDLDIREAIRLANS